MTMKRTSEIPCEEAGLTASGYWLNACALLAEPPPGVDIDVHFRGDCTEAIVAFLAAAAEAEALGD